MDWSLWRRRCCLKFLMKASALALMSSSVGILSNFFVIWGVSFFSAPCDDDDDDDDDEDEGLFLFSLKLLLSSFPCLSEKAWWLWREGWILLLLIVAFLCLTSKPVCCVMMEWRDVCFYSLIYMLLLIN